MAEDNQVVNLGSSTASGEARLTNVGILNTKTVNLILEQKSRSKEVTADSTCPFPRDDKFISRKGVFERLEWVLAPSTQTRWGALYGLGGIGKSQIAIEYTYRVREQDPSIWVFWIYANSRESIVQSFRTAAERLDLPGHQDPEADVPRLFEQWLIEESNGAWLLVLDNVDQADLLKEADQAQRILGSGKTRSLLSYIPKKPHGRVLVTSRDQKSAYSIIPVYACLIPIGGMDEDESLALLRTRAHIEPEDESTAKDLVSALEYLPLAISQAGAYIQEQGELYSVGEYLDEFRASEANQTALLYQQSEELRRDTEVPNSVILTWEISFRQLEKRSAEAVNILYLMSVLHRQDIPLELVRMYEKLETRNALNLLQAFSFITVSQSPLKLFSEDERMLTLHRLIQIATRKWLESRGQLNDWRSTSLKRVCELFSVSSEYGDWRPYHKSLTLHAYEALKCDWTDNGTTETNRGVLFRHLANYDILIGDYSQAVEKATLCDQIFRRVFPGDKLVMCAGMKIKALAYYNQGLFAEAETMRAQIVEMQQEELGVDHEDVLESMTDLATSMESQGRLTEAEKLRVNVTERRTLTLGADHPDTLDSMGFLGGLYLSQDRLQEAREILEAVLESELRTRGLQHISTIDNMSNLAVVTRKLGRLDDAERLNKEVITQLGILRGPNHPKTLDSMANLATIYWYQGRQDEAEEIETHVLDVQKTTMGYDHPDTLFTMHSLAVTYMSNMKPGHDRSSEGMALMSEVVRLRTKKLGKDHPKTIRSQQMLEEWENGIRY